MPRVKLTDRFIAGVKADRRTDYFDAVTPGLVLRVAAGGRRTSWCLFYTSPLDGKRARVGLGAYPALRLADARTKAIEAAGAAAGGSDPRRTVKASASHHSPGHPIHRSSRPFPIGAAGPRLARRLPLSPDLQGRLR